MSFGWLFDGLDSSSAGCSVLDSFVVPAGGSVNKFYSTDVIKFAHSIHVSITPQDAMTDYALYTYPSATTSINPATGNAGVLVTGGSLNFLVVVFIR